MDLRRMLRTMRYSQIEQRADPKTGERLIPPSIKFAAFLVLVVAAGALLFVVAQQVDQGTGGAGTSLSEPGTPADGNNTTEPDDPTPTQAAAPLRLAPPAPALAADR